MADGGTGKRALRLSDGLVRRSPQGAIARRDGRRGRAKSRRGARATGVREMGDASRPSRARKSETIFGCIDRTAKPGRSAPAEESATRHKAEWSVKTYPTQCQRPRGTDRPARPSKRGKPPLGTPGSSGGEQHPFF